MRRFVCVCVVCLLVVPGERMLYSMSLCSLYPGILRVQSVHRVQSAKLSKQKDICGDPINMASI